MGTLLGMVLLLVLGVVLLLAAGVCLLVRAGAGRTTAMLDGASPVSAAALDGAAGRVTLQGNATAGPQGAVQGPLTGRPCVWFTTVVTEHWFEYDFPLDLTVRENEPHRLDKQERTNRTLDYSTTPFAVQDASGEAAVAPVSATPDGLTVSREDREEPPFSTHSLPDSMQEDDEPPLTPGQPLPTDPDARRRLRPVNFRSESWHERGETILEAGTTVHVTGDIVRAPDGTVAVGGDRVVISTRPPAAMLAENEQRRGTLGRVAAGLAAVGLVLVVAGVLVGVLS